MGMFEAAQIARKSVKPDTKGTAGGAAKSADPAVKATSATDEGVRMRWSEHHSAQAKHHEALAKVHADRASYHREQMGKFSA